MITAFNFPVAVWSWNTLIAATCGELFLWKPFIENALTAIAVHNTIAPILAKHDLDGVFNLVIGPGREIGERLINDTRIPLCERNRQQAKMGRHVGEVVGRRLGRTILELGGNNAIIITENADWIWPCARCSSAQ